MSFYFPSVDHTACVRGRDHGVSIPAGNSNAHGASADRRLPHQQAIEFTDGLSSQMAVNDKEKADAVAIGGLRRCTKAVEKISGMAAKGAAVGAALDVFLNAEPSIQTDLINAMRNKSDEVPFTTEVMKKIRNTIGTMVGCADPDHHETEIWGPTCG